LSKMEKLSKPQRELISKMGQTRLVTKLRDAGYSEEDLDVMDRPAMLNARAECVAAGQDKPKIAVQTVGYDVELEREKLAFEMRRFEAQDKSTC
jgi:hypothetical protein